MLHVMEKNGNEMAMKGEILRKNDQKCDCGHLNRLGSSPKIPRSCDQDQDFD